MIKFTGQANFPPSGWPASADVKYSTRAMTGRNQKCSLTGEIYKDPESGSVEKTGNLGVFNIQM